MGFETCCFGDGNTELFHRAIPCTDFLNRCAIQGPENEPMHFDPGVSFRSIYPRYVYIYICARYIGVSNREYKCSRCWRNTMALDPVREHMQLESGLKTLNLVGTWRIIPLL